jgi:SAM-dependent methyltransferase
MRTPMPQQAEWWSTFFSGIALDAQRQLNPPEQAQREADFLVKSLRLTPGAAVADVPCGNGRIAIELAARGYRVTGVDLTAGLLADGRRAAAERNVEVAFEHRDMRDLPWPGAFDGVFCFGNSFGYLDDPGQQDFLAAVNGALKPGGRFAMETGLAAESLLAHHASNQRNWFPVGNTLMLREASYDPLLGHWHTDYTFIQDGKSETKRATYRVYMYRELVAMLKRAGFGEVDGSGSLAGDPFPLGSRVLYLTATKIS